MSLKSRYGILYFLVLFSLCGCFGYYNGGKMRAQKIQEYGEKLSSVEDDAALKLGRFENNTNDYHAKVKGENEENKDTDDGNEENENSTSSSTLCTTDKKIDIGHFQPVSGEDKTSGEDDNHTNVLEKPDVDSKEVDAVTKVYIPPKKDQLPDHYIDDV